jgi:hypothetical protein
VDSCHTYLGGKDEKIRVIKIDMTEFYDEHSEDFASVSSI